MTHGPNPTYASAVPIPIRRRGQEAKATTERVRARAFNQFKCEGPSNIQPTREETGSKMAQHERSLSSATPRQYCQLFYRLIGNNNTKSFIATWHPKTLLTFCMSASCFSVGSLHCVSRSRGSEHLYNILKLLETLSILLDDFAFNVTQASIPDERPSDGSCPHLMIMSTTVKVTTHWVCNMSVTTY